MTTLTDLLIERKKRNAKYFKNPLNWARLVKKEAEKSHRAKVFLFGSLARGGPGPESDIDIMVISSGLKNAQEKSKMRTAIIRKLGLATPLELHLIAPTEWRRWYSHFINRKEMIEV